jgi:hypothetical protein
MGEVLQLVRRHQEEAGQVEGTVGEHNRKRDVAPAVVGAVQHERHGGTLLLPGLQVLNLAQVEMPEELANAAS